MMNKSHITCCIKGCTKTKRENYAEDAKKIKFYSFPSANSYTPWKQKQRDQWIAEIRKNTTCGKSWIPSRSSRICSVHFYGNEKSEHPLHPSYVPTIFPGTHLSLKKMDQKLNRFHRTQQRVKRNFTPKVTNKKNYSEISNQNYESPEEFEILSPFKNFIDCGCQTETYRVEDDVEREFHFCSLFNQNDKCSAAVQVDIYTKKIISNEFNPENARCSKIFKHSSTQCTSEEIPKCSGFHGIYSIKSDKEMSALSGVSITNFNYLCKKLSLYLNNSNLSKENKLLLCLMKLKLGATFSALACFFKIHRTTARNIFFTILENLRILLHNAIFWPSKQLVQSCLPGAFRDNYPTTRVIIDCSEVRTEQASHVSDQVYLYSNYKHGSTVKFLIGCTPNGFISFVSDCYGGRSGDCFITVDSGLITLLESGDTVLADKGFPSIQTNLSDKNVILVMPPFANKDQFSPEEVQETYKIASVRIHVERLIQRIKDFYILRKIPMSLLSHSDDIIYVICSLINFENPIIKNLE